jgi:hypothetical protein
MRCLLSCKLKCQWLLDICKWSGSMRPMACDGRSIPFASALAGLPLPPVFLFVLKICGSDPSPSMTTSLCRVNTYRISPVCTESEVLRGGIEEGRRIVAATFDPEGRGMPSEVCDSLALLYLYAPLVSVLQSVTPQPCHLPTGGSFVSGRERLSTHILPQWSSQGRCDFPLN